MAVSIKTKNQVLLYSCAGILIFDLFWQVNKKSTNLVKNLNMKMVINNVVFCESQKKAIDDAQTSPKNLNCGYVTQDKLL